MAKPNISLLGATYSGVAGVTLPTSGGGSATFPWVEGSETKTANGTYDVTNLAQLVVNVSGGGGATNFVTGTFTTGSTTQKAETFTIPYTGTGYPIMLTIVIEGGAYNSTSSGNTTWYNSTQRYAIGLFSLTKARMTEAPTYATSGAANYGVVALIYKNNASTSTTYSRTSTMSANSFTSSSTSANSTSTTAVRFMGNGTTVSYYIGYYTSSSSYQYGLMANTTYRYYAVYSS